MAAETWRFPPALEDVEERDVDAWIEAADEVNDPVAASRLHDLLWERRAGQRPDTHARAAAKAYLSLSHESTWHAMERTRCVTRALELARAVNDRELVREVTERAISFVVEVLAAKERGPGAALVVARALVTLPDDERPPELMDLLASSRTRFGDDPFIADSIADLEAQLVEPAAQEELRRAQVSQWRGAAGEGDQLMRVIRLERALEIARIHGLANEANEIRRELQDISPDSLDLKPISAQIEIATEDLEEYFASIVEHDDWRESLRHFGSEGPPGGDPEELDEQLAQEREEFVFSRLFTRTVMGPGSVGTQFRAADDASRERLERAERRQWEARMWSPFYAEALDRIATHHGVPDHGELTDFFRTELIDGERAEPIARAFDLYWQGQWDESAHLVVPRLEAIFRDMARTAGLVVIRDPEGAVPGGVRPLGTLMRELEGAFPDQGWHAYLFNLLADPLGLNLRNAIAHGLTPSVSHGDAALLLHATSFLRLLGVTPAREPLAEDP